MDCWKFKKRVHYHDRQPYKELAQAWDCGSPLYDSFELVSFTFLNQIWRSYPANGWQGGRRQAGVLACRLARSGCLIKASPRASRGANHIYWWVLSWADWWRRIKESVMKTKMADKELRPVLCMSCVELLHFGGNQITCSHDSRFFAPHFPYYVIV